MTHIEQTIELFGGVRPMAKMLGHNNPSTVQSWKEKNKIPSWRWHEIEHAAKQNDIVLPPPLPQPHRGGDT